MIRLRAPAKINLSFEVLGRRTDGFHEVRTVLAAVDLADELDFQDADRLTLSVEPDGAAPIEHNLVLRAAGLLRDACGVPGGASIVLRKRIPVAAGLGGGSSDAAATLLGLRRLWGLDLPGDRLAELAAELGSDVRFFLGGGTALARGRGDELTRLPQPLERFAVIATPEEHVEGKTSRMYGLLGPHHYSDGGPTAEVARRIQAGQPVSGVGFNAFEPVAGVAYASYGPLRARFVESGAHPALLCGAGPAMFALADDEAEVDGIAQRIAAAGYDACAVRLLPPWGTDGLGPGGLVREEGPWPQPNT